MAFQKNQSDTDKSVLGYLRLRSELSLMDVYYLHMYWGKFGQRSRVELMNGYSGQQGGR